MQILIAEDDPASRAVLVRTLERLGHDVIVTEDGAAAWKLFEAVSCRVVITDWMMPGMTGLELCRAIRRAKRAEYTYVLILTALSGKGRYLEGMDAGADDFLTKPLDRDELRARLRVAERILGLEAEVRQLTGLLPICSYCKKIRSEGGSWTNIERYIGQRSEASFTHSICPHCYETEIEAELRDMAGG